MMKDLKLESAGEFLRRNQHSAMMTGVTALVVAMSAWTSCSARTIAKDAEARIGEAAAIRATATRFSQQFMPATTGETDEWARTTAEAAEFGTPEALRVATAQTVSRIGEVAGLSTARASFTPVEAVGLAETRNMGDLVFQPATFGLRLEGNGTISAVSRVILRLAPSTEITSLSLAGDTYALKATFQLAVYQPAGGTQN
jgi:hypothetical protein